MRIVTLPGVFAPISDSWLLAGALLAHVGSRSAVLDVCTGSGALAVTAALHGARAVTAVDVSRRAVWTARLNARLNGARVRAVRGDLLDAIPGERFDVIVSNPPYVPGTDAPARGAARAWEAGGDGRAVLDRLIADAPAHLRPGGALLIVQSTIVGEARTLAAMRTAGLEPDVIERRRGPLGPLMSDRARRGLLPPGTREEDVLVIRGRARRTSPA